MSETTPTAAPNLGRVIEELSGGSFRYFNMILVNVVAIVGGTVGIGALLFYAIRDRETLKVFDGQKFSWVVAVGFSLMLAIIVASAFSWISFRSSRRKGRIRICEHGMWVQTPGFETKALWTDVRNIHEHRPSSSDLLNSFLTGPTWTISAESQPRFYVFGYDVPSESEFSRTLQGAAARYQFEFNIANEV